MAKRGKHGSGRTSGQKDNPIGLTGAFDPISIDESRRYDDPVGLTQAFGPVEDPETTVDWDSSDKWQGFDWNAPVPGAQDDEASDADGEEMPLDQEASDAAGHGRHARHASSGAAVSADEDSQAVSKPRVSERMERSRRARKRLVGIIVLLLIIAAALGVAGYTLLTGSVPFVGSVQESAPATETSEEAMGPVVPNSKDSQEVASAVTDIPELASLFGKTQKEAIEQIGHGAIVTSSAKIDNEESAIKETVTLELSDEPGNPRSGGTPKVYLGLDQDGRVLQVGYSSPVGLLGYGTLNFKDAVASEHVIEKTLQAIGAKVEEGAAALPKDEKDYTTYDSDGSTVAKERYSFDGNVDAGGVPCSWSAVLSYDYTSANISGNASETVRLIYVYLTQK